jgi:hypothetical protein
MNAGLERPSRKKWHELNNARQVRQRRIVFRSGKWNEISPHPNAPHAASCDQKNNVTRHSPDCVHRGENSDERPNRL